MNYGTDLKVKKSSGHHSAGKASPRSGAAKGQGNGMGGYNAGAVNKTMGAVKGGGGKPSYSCGSGKMR